MSETVIDELFIAQVKQLLQHAESGEEQQVNDLLDELSSNRDTALYKKLGKLTRDLHEALGEFNSDNRLAEITNNEISDARERLNFVVSKTQEAAEFTMTQVENSIPICNSIIDISDELSQSWDKLTSREMKVDEFRELSKKIKVFLSTANNDGKTLKTNLNEMLLAQDFQDITGQVIFKVIKLVEYVEHSLVNLVSLASEHIAVEENSNKNTDQGKKKGKASLDGPVVPGVADMKETVSGQDEVDDLLSSLGF